MVVKKSGDQESYLDRGSYDKALRSFTPRYLRFHQAEENFFGDNIREGSDVLDVGCGELRTTVLLAVHVGSAGRVVGIDFNEKMFQAAKKKAEVLKNVEVRRMDARKLDELEIDFDYILFPFEFIGLLPQKDQVPVLRKAKGRLNPDGKILATVFSEYAPIAQIEMYQRMWKPRTPRFEGKYVYGGDGYRAETFTEDEITEIFLRAGLKPTVGRLTKMGYSIKAPK